MGKKRNNASRLAGRRYGPYDFEAMASNTALPMLPQLVPSQVCFGCTVCCRFPEADSFLRPYFTDEEVHRAVAAGVNRSSFPDPSGTQVKLVPHPNGEGFICPAFDPDTSHCTIYAVRPLDCQIYPFALMWNQTHTEVMLGWDSKCPFLPEGTEHRALANRQGGDESISGSTDDPANLKALASSPALDTYAVQIAELVERDATLAAIAAHPRLIGPFQEDVVVLRTLPVLTRRLTVTGVPRSLLLTSLSIRDRQKFDAICAAYETALGAYAFAWHFIWKDLFAYSYAKISNHFCLFAQYADGIYMPLPPLLMDTRHSSLVTRHGDASLVAAVEGCFDFMRERNGGSAVSRIENVAEGQRCTFEGLGYRVAAKDPDYVYRTTDLVTLAGDRYKAQRAAVNQFRRLGHVRMEPYCLDQRDACLRLLHDWAEQKRARGLDEPARHMLEDSMPAHRQALTYFEELGLRGSVVRVGEAIRGYTFGYDRSPKVFCILLEVADRSIHGLAQFLFQKTCEEAQQRNVEYVNALDDSGLADLAKTKQAYHPVELVASYVVTEN